jgi:hypothetical protein
MAAAMLLTTLIVWPADARLRAGRWPPGAAIKVWVGPSRERADDPVFVERAMATWTRAAAGRFRLDRTPDQRAAAIRVRFTKGDAHLGETSPLTDLRTGFILEADIAIASNLNADPLVQRIVIYMTALHELGHALGLPHSEEFSDIMYLFRRPDDAERFFGAYRTRVRSQKDIGSPAATGLSPGDAGALLALYSD